MPNKINDTYGAELIGERSKQAAGGLAPLQETKHHGFASKLGFVLAAAGSAVGLGNLWRFPYLAAKYGGGIFILCYLLLAVTFGFCLLVLEIAIGRKTGKNVIGAFSALSRKFKWLGILALVVPIIIVPYYCVIGGWVTYYIYAFAAGNEMLVGETASVTTSGEAFNGFISDPWMPLIFFLVFAVITVFVVVFGVQKGIERMSKILMPLLAVIAVGLMIYVLCQPGATEGLKVLFVPNFEDFKFETLLAALGQLFYSMSLAMGIMVTYGSYMKKDAKITSSARQISICDSAFAIVAAVIIIPSIFAYSDDPNSAMAKSGPSLMFIQLPAVFNNIQGGRWLGVVFFVLVFFAALTSSISLVETIVAVLKSNGLTRVVSCVIVFVIMLVLGTLSSLGFGPLSMISIGDKTLLDIFDYVSNSILMPIVAIGTCIVAGYFCDTRLLMDEAGLLRKSTRTYFRIMIRYIAPVCMALILISGIFLDL